MPKRRDNHGAASCPNKDNRAVAQAFFRLGSILAEIAEDVVRRKAHSNQDLAKNRISRNQNEKRKD